MHVLSVTHGPSVGGGVFEETAERLGHRLDRWLVPLGGPAPDPAAFGAIMVFGGGMHPDEDARHPWLPGEAAFLGRALEAGVPMLGVCLGAQLIARAAGAPVGPAHEPEIGWLPLELTPAGMVDPVLGALPSRLEAFQWHWYAFGVPAGGEELASSPGCTQAFRLGRARGVQFHPEVTRAMIERWIAEDGHELPMPPEELMAQTAPRIGAWNETGRRLCGAFLEDAAR